MLTIEAAIELLSKMDRKAVLVIGGVLVEGIEAAVNGRIREGHGCRTFTPVEKGRDRAVYFTRQTEHSDGVFYSTRL